MRCSSQDIESPYLKLNGWVMSGRMWVTLESLSCAYEAFVEELLFRT